MESHPLSRHFEFNGVRLPDIDPKLSPEEIRTLYSHTYPDIATASITGPDPCPLFFDLCNTSSHTHAAPRATREFLSVWSFSA